MRDLVRGYGRGLVGLFFAATAVWVVLLILAPQVAVFRDALVKPPRKLDSAIAAQVATDASDCRSILERQGPPAAASPGFGAGIEVPVPGAPAAPQGFGAGIEIPGAPAPAAGVPSAPGARPTVLQCLRADTAQPLWRPEGAPRALLTEVWGVERVAVDVAADAATQMAQADRVRAVAAEAAARIREAEAQESPYGLQNFATLFAARAIPMSAEAREAERASWAAAAQRLFGLRFERDGQVFVRLGLMTLATTLASAAAATLLSLTLCYPIAYKLALASGPRKAAWLLTALLVPYAVIELMRVYAWLSIIENRGAINMALEWVGLIDAGSPIEFKRSPITVFVVVVYTYVLFMMFPLVNAMGTLDRAQIEAARDLGASTLRIHRRVVLPHAKPGVAVGCIATFMLAAGAFSVPRIISRGLQGQWFAESIYESFFEANAVNVGAAYAFVFTVVCFAIIAVFMRLMRARLSDFVRA